LLPKKAALKNRLKKNHEIPDSFIAKFGNKAHVTFPGFTKEERNCEEYGDSG
jgi:hypothetical protein